MSIIKNRASGSIIIFLLSAALFAGCSPPGPRALLKGQRLIDEGRYTEAIEQLKLAASILSTNAQVWNSLGVAFQHAGQVTNSVQVYRRALGLDANLIEAHHNLGCLWLEQHRPDLAKTEFIAYTLQNPNVADSWVQLGNAELQLSRTGNASTRASELQAAEKSFNAALHLNAQYPEALNGLGLVQMQRDRTAAAAQYFENALKVRSDYAPALLNLAVVCQTHLNKKPYALEKYREYLNLKPRPTDWDAVNAVAHELERELTSPPGTNPPTAALPPRRSTPDTPTKQASNVVVQVPERKPAPITNAVKTPTVAAVTTAEVVRVSPPPTIRPAQDISVPDTNAISQSTQPRPEVATNGSQEASTAPKRGFFRRINPLNLFRKNSKPTPSNTTAVAESTTAQGASPTNPIVPTFPRYQYRSISKPETGDHVAAERAFAQGWQSQQAGRATETIQAYRQAVALDPAYFDAYYNLALAATSAGNYSEALSAYETALAIHPESSDARYNFALVLQKMNYVQDAESELENLLGKYPNESRAHVALGNIYSQQLHENGKAREHYTKALEINPSSPQSAAIRYWLSANAR